MTTVRVSLVDCYVLRGAGRQLECLLLRRAPGGRCPGSWEAVHGHIEPGEDPRNTAVREVKEETGYWARIVGWLGDHPQSRDAGAPMVRWFLLEACEAPRRWRPENRRRCWHLWGPAIEKATFDETKALLRSAAERFGSDAQSQKRP